jgi:response regulator RpfG family c-di-GMP phosphodiesterase
MVSGGNILQKQNIRKKRAVIYDDDDTILKVLKEFLSMRDYEVFTFQSPVICPLGEIEKNSCQKPYPCADIIISDFNMPKMDGITLFQQQLQMDCKVDVRNKAIMSGYLEEKHNKMLGELGVHFFQKPINFSDLTRWLDQCEQRINLYQPLGSRRRDARTIFSSEIEYTLDLIDKSRSGSILNLSKNGLCMKIQEPLIRHQIVKINTSLPISCKMASVRWIKPARDNFYTVGLYCTAES